MPSGWPPHTVETTLARNLDGHYARAGLYAYALIREALTTSGDIHPRPLGQILHLRLDLLMAPRRTQALAASLRAAQPTAQSHYLMPISRLETRSSPTPALHDLFLYVRSPGGRRPGRRERHLQRPVTC